MSGYERAIERVERSTLDAIDDHYQISGKQLWRAGDWMSSMAEPVEMILDGRWSGLQKAAGRRFARDLIRVLVWKAIQSTDRHPSVPASALPMIQTGIQRLTLMREPAGFKALQEVAIVAMKSIQGAFGVQGGGGSAQAALSVMSALMRAGGEPLARSLGDQLLPRWQLKCGQESFNDAETIAKIYALMLESGLRMEDLARAWKIAPKPGMSVADQLSQQIERFKCEPIQGALRAELVKQGLQGELQSQSERLESQLEAPGIEPGKLSKLLNLIAIIESGEPGQGADRAIEWLAEHPSVKERLQESAMKAAPSMPKTKTKRM